MSDDDARYRVDARHAEGLQIGDHGTQFNYFYNRTWADGVAPPPLIVTSGLVTSPYRGLGAFGERDAGLFFGRDGAVAEVLELMSRRLDEPGLLVLSGVSGAGKSSLMRAGVVPRLRGAGLRQAPEAAAWPCLVLTPEREPLRELATRVAPLAGADAGAVSDGIAAAPARFALTAQAAALAQQPSRGAHAQRDSQDPAGQRLIIVVDQCEQLFTRCESEQDRKAFITALHAAATSGHGRRDLPAALVVLMVRADFEARLADYPQLTEAVKDRYLLTSMTELQLRLAITQPAIAVGSSVDDGLVQALLEEVRAVRGAGFLPLLSHALDQAWRGRVGQQLTLADYERSGGIEGAVAASAERAYGALTSAQQAEAQRVFTRLTAVGDDGRETAARAARSELIAGKSPGDVDTVLETFAAERLLTLAAGTVEISHEALLTAWPLLRDSWLAGTRADRLIRTRLRATAQEWAGAARDPSYLYGGNRLQTAMDTVDRGRQTPVSGVERDFLNASKRARRRRKRLRRGLFGLLACVVMGVPATVVVISSADSTADSARAATNASLLTGQSEALGDLDPATSKLDSIEAWRLHPSPQAWYGMLNAATLPGIANLDGAGSAQFSPVGDVLAANTGSGSIQLWNGATRKPLGSPVPAAGSFVFSPAGKTLAIGPLSGPVRIWDIAARRWVGPVLRGFGTPAAFSPDGAVLAIANLAWMQLWNVHTGKLLTTIAYGEQYGENSVAFSPAGNLLAVGFANNRAGLWDVAAGRWIGGRPGAITACTDNDLPAGVAVAFSPDGQTLATGCGPSGFNPGTGNGLVELFDVATRARIGEPITVDAPVSQVAFSPDGKVLAVGAEGSNSEAGVGGGTFLFDTTTHRQLGGPLLGNGPVSSVAFSADGATLASGAQQGGIQLWSVAIATGAPDGPPVAVGGEVTEIAVSPGQAIAAVVGATGKVQLIAAATGREIGNPITIPGDDIVNVLAFSPNGRLLAVGTVGGKAYLITVATGRLTGTPATFGNEVSVLAFAPDSKTLAIGSGSQVRLWDHRAIGAPLTFTPGVNALAFSPDGAILAIAGGSYATGGSVELAEPGREIRRISVPGGPVYSVAFSPSGTMLATGDADGVARLLNQASGQLTASLTSSGGWGIKVAFSPDGATLAFATQNISNANGAVQLFDLQTSQQIGTPLTLTGMLSSMEFSRDGTSLITGITATASNPGILQRWNTSYLVKPESFLCSLERQAC